MVSLWQYTESISRFCQPESSILRAFPSDAHRSTFSLTWSPLHYHFWKYVKLLIRSCLAPSVNLIFEKRKHSYTNTVHSFDILNFYSNKDKSPIAQYWCRNALLTIELGLSVKSIDWYDQMRSSNDYLHIIPNESIVADEKNNLVVFHQRRLVGVGTSFVSYLLIHFHLRCTNRRAESVD